MTDTIGMADGIIKQDTRGRMKTSPERRRALLEEFDRSAMTGRKFAAWAGIKYTTFANWLGARRKAATAQPPKDRTEKTDGTRWLEAVVGSPRLTEPILPSSAVLIVHGPGGLRLELSEAGQVPLAARLLRELGWKAGC